MIDEDLKQQSKVVGVAIKESHDDDDADDDDAVLTRQQQQQLPSVQSHHHPHFHLRPAASFHEALLRLIPLQATKIRHKASPRSHSQPKPVPHADSKPRAQRECRCEREQRHKQQHKDKGSNQSESEEESKTKEIRASELDGCEGGQKGQEKPWGATYRSCGLYCEVKLAELLGQAGERALSSPTSSSQEPHAYRTRICIQVPYFDLVRRLEEKVKEMEEKFELCEVLLLQKQSDVDRVKQDMQELKNQLKNANAGISNLQARLGIATESLEAAKSQVRSMQEKSKKMKCELQKAKLEVQNCQQQEYEREMEKGNHEKLKAQYVQLVHELQHTQTFLDSARSEAADRVSKEDYCVSKLQMLEVQGRLVEAQAEVNALKDATAALTPRPQWGLLCGRSNQRLSTVELVTEFCRENAYLSEQLLTLQQEKIDARAALTEALEKVQLKETENGGKEVDKKTKQKPKKG